MKIDYLKETAKHTYDYSDVVEAAYMQGFLRGRGVYLPEAEETTLTFSRFGWEKVHHKGVFISETGDAWHEEYRKIRRAGWKRESFKQEGALREYIFNYPLEDGLTAKMSWCITMQTCRRVKVGEELVDKYETVCGDLKEPEGE